MATPTASATSLVAHLSIAIAPAPTPDPTYGRPASSHNAASVPSSPSGPWTAGSATSQLRSTEAAPVNPIGRPPPSYQLPPRPMVSGTTSYVVGSRWAQIAAAEASETSCSQFAPPPITATRTRSSRVIGSPARRCR